ncbi:hypothetical protein, partial [Romboutsia sp.]|uniref:glycosyltransferase n=1 Tax=Romboutsia sp. TaxID=1965302 RepID=UPI002B75F904
GGVLDIIIESQNGFFSSVGDEESLAKMILKSRALKFNGYNYITNNFSLKNMVEKTIAVYEGLLKR